MEKHYVIRINLNGEKEQVFEGTLKEALDLQKEWGTEEEDLIKIEDISFDDLITRHFFGDDAYSYEEVTKEEYNKCK